MHVTVPLSRLTAGRRNPRKVRPEREAHRRLVASIRAYGLLEPLIVKPDSGGEGDGYRVIAGKRRLAALRDVYRGAETAPEIPCEVRDVDAATADALSLSENFAREGMHPLDEAEAFAKLASIDCKGVAAIASEFGVSAGYVRQRMKLATLADPIKAAYRNGEIDTGTAEAFAAVPRDRQIEVWKELGGHPRDAQHVRAVIQNGWIDARHARFDVEALPEGAVSRDLFHERVLIERKAFLEAQTDALIAEREALIEDGWGEVVIAPQADVQDRLWSMAPAEGEVDEDTATRLAAVDEQRTKLDAELEALDEGDEAGCDAIYERLDELDRQREELLEAAPRHYAEATKAHATVFLLVDPDGRVRRECRMPRTPGSSAPGSGARDDGGTPPPPTSEDLTDRQKATTYTHRALAVRGALLENDKARRCVLALLLHEKVRADGLTVRHDANTTDLHADNAEGFVSSVLEALRQRLAELDPFAGNYSIEASTAYRRLMDLPDTQLGALIDVLTVHSVIAHLHRQTELVALLADELGVNVRRYWRPDAAWLAGFKKIQLAHLIGQLRGSVHEGPALKRKKSELVEELAGLFADAAEDRIADPELADRLNTWLPANLRQEQPEDANRCEAETISHAA
jgi:ParB family chromosome partitioning protein